MRFSFRLKWNNLVERKIKRLVGFIFTRLRTCLEGNFKYFYRTCRFFFFYRSASISPWIVGLFQEFVIFWKTVQKHVYVSKINFVVLGGGSQKSISKEQRGRFGSRQTSTTNRMWAKNTNWLWPWYGVSNGKVPLSCCAPGEDNSISLWTSETNIKHNSTVAFVFLNACSFFGIGNI